MTHGAADPTIEYQPRLVEEAVLLVVRGRKEEGEFWKCRDSLYETPDPDEREAGFLAFSGAWFGRLGLGRPVRQALLEYPLIVEGTTACVVSWALAGKDEGADLHVSPPNVGGRSVGIRLRPERFTDEERLLQFLRRELLHVADMLDPRFGYAPRLPASGTGPAHERLLQDRYRVLWGAYVDGRLLRLGWAPAVVRTDRFDDFVSAFPMLGERAEAAFGRFFDGSTVTHGELAAFAADPEHGLGRRRGGPHPGERCPLCGFPTHAFEPRPDRLLAERVRESFPGWDPEDGLCRQCADLYRSRSPEAVR